MPTLLTTAFNALRYPSAANNGAEFAEGIENLADDVDERLSFGCVATTGIVAVGAAWDNLPWTVSSEVGGWTLASADLNLVVPSAGLYGVQLDMTGWAGGTDVAARVAINQDPELYFSGGLLVENAAHASSPNGLCYFRLKQFAANDVLRVAGIRAGGAGSVEAILTVTRLG